MKPTNRRGYGVCWSTPDKIYVWPALCMSQDGKNALKRSTLLRYIKMHCFRCNALKRSTLLRYSNVISISVSF
jgi:hypothetical protein